MILSTAILAISLWVPSVQAAPSPAMRAAIIGGVIGRQRRENERKRKEQEEKEKKERDHENVSS